RIHPCQRVAVSRFEIAGRNGTVVLGARPTRTATTFSTPRLSKSNTYTPVCDPRRRLPEFRGAYRHHALLVTSSARNFFAQCSASKTPDLYCRRLGTELRRRTEYPGRRVHLGIRPNP